MPMTASLPSRTSNRFRSASSLKSAALVGAIAAPAIGHAQVITYSGTLNQALGKFAINLDFNQNTSSDASEISLKIKDFDEFSVNGGSSVHLTSLSFGSLIDGSLSYSALSPDSSISLSANLESTGYFAFAWDNGGGDQYGWFQWIRGDYVANATLIDWAYSTTPGASITAGQTTAVPEPGTFGALLGGAVLAVTCLRRRRSTRRSD